MPRRARLKLAGMTLRIIQRGNILDEARSVMCDERQVTK